MKSVLLFLIACLLAVSSSFGQGESQKTYRNFPVVVTLQFNAISMPFRNLKLNFRNPGIGIGTEISLNGKHNWAQQFTMIWYRNRAAGNGLLLYSQVAWRPSYGTDVYTEFKAGLGYLWSFRPVESFRRENGKWISAAHHPKGMLALPVGVAVGYNSYSEKNYASPFVGYQFVLLNKYNKDIPIVPQTYIQVGSRIHF